MNPPTTQPETLDHRLRRFVAPSRRRLRDVLTAWSLSIVLHAVGLGLMLMVVFPFRAAPDDSELPRVHAQVIGDVDAPPSPAPSSASAAARSIGDSSTPRFQPNPNAVPGAGAGIEGSGGVAGIGPIVPNRSGSDLTVIGIGAGTGGTGGTGIGLDGGGSAEFFGAGGAVQGVRHVVYVVDRSGSMLDTFHLVKVELKRSISNLRRSQKFHVIFFNSGDPLENPPQRLVNAIASIKEQFFSFLETVQPGGSTKPERAMKRALALEPDILYLLSDGISFDSDLPAKLNDWNRERKTRIFTIAYLDQEGRGILETIAREHGGEFKFISENDLP